MERARQTRLMSITFEKYMTDIVPLAIQVELYFSDNIFGHFSVRISPFVMIHCLANHLT